MRRTLLAAAVATLLAPWPALGSAPPCKPGSGPHPRRLGGLTAESLRSPASVRCAYLVEANLAGADLAQIDLSGADLDHANLRGADLTQADLTGATLRQADLENAELTQATLNGASFEGANLAHAKMIQAEAKGTSFDGADLSNVDLTQGTLTGAVLDHARLGGVDLTQAELHGTTWHGVTGVPRWSRTILITALIVLGLLVAFVVRSTVKRGGGAALAVGLGGALLVALGVNLHAGGFVGTSSTGGPPPAQICGPRLLCDDGVSSGIGGFFGGLVAIFVGGFVVVARRRLTRPATP